MKNYLGLILVLICTIVSEKGYCWGDEGHSIVALEAQQILNQQSKAGNVQATKALKAIQTILGTTKIDEAAIWPDKVKTLARDCNKAPYQNKAICDAYKYTSSWHFVNTDASQYVLNPKDPNYFKGDVVVLLRGLTHILKGEPAPTLKGVTSFTAWKTQCLKKASHDCKKEALEFVIHLIGDTHQPLHSGSLCDYGGNNQYVIFFGQEKDPGAVWCKPSDSATCNNQELHQVWDTSLLTHAPDGKPFGSNSAYAAKLLTTQAGKKHSSDTTQCVITAPEAVVQIDEPNGPAAWINESLCYTPQAYTFPDDNTASVKDKKRAVAQAELRMRELANRCRTDRQVPDGRNIDYAAFQVAEKYYETNIVTINERLYWSGERLASLLKDIYGNGDPVSGELK